MGRLRPGAATTSESTSFVRTPDGHSRLELTKFQNPVATTSRTHRRYEDTYRLCYVRGPGGIIVALAEELS